MLTRIKELDDYGRGIAFVNDKITFITNSLENELVEYKILTEKKKYNEAITLKILEKSKDRIDPPCKYYSICGGCHLEHLNEKKENSFKTQRVKNILKKFASIEISNLEIIYKSPYNYRNKVTLTVKNNKIGLLKEKSNELVEVDKCLLLNDKLNEVIKVLKQLVKKEPNITKIMLRVGNKTNEVMLSITGKVNDYKKFLPLANSLIINNKPITKNYITSYISNQKYYLHSNSFFQVNDSVVELLYEEVLNIIKTIQSKRVIDLYCGVGTIGLYLSPYLEKVIGVEVIKDAIVDANKNKELNNIKNISFINAKVEDILTILPKDFDTIIIDPPRSGLDKKTRAYLKDSKVPNIIYISCDAITLARDLNEIKENYSLKSIKLFNMFPRTYHVESIVLLSRKKNIKNS